MQPIARMLGRASRPLWARLLLAASAWGPWRSCPGPSGTPPISTAAASATRPGATARAAASLERFLDRRPADPRACEAHLRLGRIYARRFGRYLEAKRHFEAAARDPARSVVLRAWRPRPNCSIAPIISRWTSGRSWVYGDTASGGRNMRLEVEVRAAPGGKAAQTSALFAGKKRISVSTKDFVKKDWAVWELAGGKESMLLRYPFAAGTDLEERRRPAGLELPHRSRGAPGEDLERRLLRLHQGP